MIEARPSGLVSSRFQISEDGQTVGSIRYPVITFAYRATISCPEGTYKAQARGNRNGPLPFSRNLTFLLEGKDGVVASSQPTGKWPLQKYEVVFGDQNYLLEYYSALEISDVLLRASFRLTQAGTPLGSIKARGPLCWTYQVALPPTVPLLAKLFALYLADVLSNNSPVRLHFCLGSKSL